MKKFPNIIGWISARIQAWKRRDVELSFADDIDDIEMFKAALKDTKCPGCTQTSLDFDSFTVGATGWEASIHCSNCMFQGIFNSSGFNVSSLKKK